jgi:hypothetical protein
MSLGADCERPNCQDQCCAGTCVAPAQLNDDCSTRSCARGLECVNTGPNSNVCLSGDVGALCLNDSDCDEENYCGQEQKCVADRGVNVPCTSNSQCAFPTTCVNEASGPGTCLHVDTVGAACDGFCRGDLYCKQGVDEGGITQGTCEAALGLDQSCSNGERCTTGLYCSNLTQTCKPFAELGQPCEPRRCVPGVVCSAELPSGVNPPVCVEPNAVGGECAEDEHCQTDICNPLDGKCQEYLSCY